MGHRSSRKPASAARRAPGAAALLGILAAVALLASAGCGRSGASPPGPPEPGVPRSPAPGQPTTGGPSRAGVGNGATHPLDPSEEITPEELASIPEPLPGASAALKGAQDQPMDRVAQPPPEAPSGASQTPSPAAPEAPGPGAPAWQVQIYVSDRRDEANRVSLEASRALAVPGAVVREGALYKVRLGRFATEAEAQTLRERAIQAGYSGAFRIKTTH